MKRFALLIALCTSFAYADVSYHLQPDVPAQTVSVKIRVEDPGDQPEFRIPAWCPGWYVLTACQNYISDVRATDTSGKELTIKKVDKQGWLVQNPEKGAIAFTYRVLGDEPGLGSDRVHVDKRTAFVNGPAAFMYLKGRISDKTRLTIKVPDGWDIATAMDKKEDVYVARDYDELIDSPIQMGAMQRRSFKVGGVPFEAIFVSKADTPRADVDYETRRLVQISEPAMKLFGSASFKKYLYIVHMTSGMWEQGLEHQASTVLDVSDSRPLGMDELASHEFFHAWNVKQIRPKVLGPFDYTKPCRTNNLWFAEGVTDYYGYLLVYRSGLRDKEWLSAILSTQVAMLQRCSTRLQISIDKACFQTWEHGGFGYGPLSYYNKGLLIGWILDAAIIEATNGAKNLDDVMRSMYGKYKMPKPGFEEDAILKEINAISGKDLTALYHRMVETTQELPYTVLEKAIGVRVTIPGMNYLRAGFGVENGRINYVENEQISDHLKIGDEFVEIHRPNQQGVYEVVIIRDGQKMVASVPAIPFTATSYIVEKDPFASKAEIDRRTKWLSVHRESAVKPEVTDSE